MKILPMHQGRSLRICKTCTISRLYCRSENDRGCKVQVAGCRMQVAGDGLQDAVGGDH